MTDPRVELLINGNAVRGLESLDLTYSLRALAAGLAAEVVAPSGGGAFSLRGAPCLVRHEGETVFRGFIEDVTLSASANGSGLRLGGRSAAGDLVDASVPLGTSEFLGQRLEDIARTLCAPFGIEVRARCDTGGALRSFRAQAGETIFECLARAARAQGVFLSSAADGALEIRREATASSSRTLTHGENVKSVEIAATDGRFREVVVVAGQGNSRDGSWEWSAPVIERARDGAVARPRTLVLHEAGLTTAAQAAKRAQWEVARRLGESFRARVQVQGWKEEGKLWGVTESVRLVVPSEDFDEEFVIETVRLSFSNAGMLADLELVHPAALTVEPEKEVARKRAGGWQ